jgi:hypothetical protein
LDGVRKGADFCGAVFLFCFCFLFFLPASSGPVKDLLIKAHFSHHLISLLIDWYSEYFGFVTKHWQQGLFSPHPFFTFLILFMWMTDKRRDLEAEDLEQFGKKQS